MTEQRKYALIKITAGDYLLPSNDRKTLWRVSSYTDGPSNGLDLPKDRTFWGLWRWPHPLGERADVNLDDWEGWREVECLLDTRAEAIRRTLV